MNDWNSAQYLKFERERTQPAIDLVNNIDIEMAERIIDVGCGPGNSTVQLRRRYKDAEIIGADNSADMLETAAEKYPDISFIKCDASKELGRIKGKFDIVFSNACIQWIPDHKKLIPEMMSLLKKGGVLAVQIPINYQEPIHRIIAETAESEKWKESFPNPRIFYTLSSEGYFDILSELTDDFRIWETVYFHRMKSHESIIEWYRGTGLRPYLSALSEDKGKEFETEVLNKVKKAYHIQENGEIIFRFPRLFFTAISR